MMITVQVWNATDGDASIHGTAPRRLLIARGYLPSGQDFIQSAIHEGHDPETQSAAVREITDWLHAHRPTWNITIDGPYVRFADDRDSAEALRLTARLTICVERRSADFHACLEDQRGVWGVGLSVNAAIGDLVRAHEETFGIKIVGDLVFPKRGVSS